MNHKELAPYTNAQLSHNQSEQIRQVMASVQTDGQPPMVFVTLPPDAPTRRGQESDPDRVARTLIIGIVLVVLAIVVGIFIAYIVIPGPPPPPVVHNDISHCLVWCG